MWEEVGHGSCDVRSLGRHMMRLAYADEGAGEPLVLLHGLTADRSHWDPVTALLRHDFRCVAIDLPGHGDSPDDGYSVIEQASAVHEVVIALGLESPVFVGHSAGGMSATVYAVLHQPRGVINVDQSLHVPTFAAMLGELGRYRDERFDEAMSEFVASLDLHLVPESRRPAISAAMRPRQEVVTAIWADILDGRADELNEQLAAAIVHIACPYLAIYGSEPGRASRAMVDRIPGSMLEVWDGMGHFLHLVDPETFVARVHEFVAHLAPA
jgi:pimeloyl-ACP methyl ester carboxylesterase